MLEIEVTEDCREFPGKPDDNGQIRMHRVQDIYVNLKKGRHWTEEGMFLDEGGPVKPGIYTLEAKHYLQKRGGNLRFQVDCAVLRGMKPKASE